MGGTEVLVGIDDTGDDIIYGFGRPRDEVLRSISVSVPDKFKDLARTHKIRPEIIGHNQPNLLDNPTLSIESMAMNDQLATLVPLIDARNQLQQLISDPDATKLDLEKLDDELHYLLDEQSKAFFELLRPNEIPLDYQAKSVEEVMQLLAGNQLIRFDKSKEEYTGIGLYDVMGRFLPGREYTFYSPAIQKSIGFLSATEYAWSRDADDQVELFTRTFMRGYEMDTHFLRSFDPTWVAENLPTQNTLEELVSFVQTVRDSNGEVVHTRLCLREDGLKDDIYLDKNNNSFRRSIKHTYEINGIPAKITTEHYPIENTFQSPWRTDVQVIPSDSSSELGWQAVFVTPSMSDQKLDNIYQATLNHPGEKGCPNLVMFQSPLIRDSKKESPTGVVNYRDNQGRWQELDLNKARLLNGGQSRNDRFTDVPGEGYEYEINGIARIIFTPKEGFLSLTEILT